MKQHEYKICQTSRVGPKNWSYPAGACAGTCRWASNEGITRDVLTKKPRDGPHQGERNDDPGVAGWETVSGVARQEVAVGAGGLRTVRCEVRRLSVVGGARWRRAPPAPSPAQGWLASPDQVGLQGRQKAAEHLFLTPMP